MVGVRVRFGTEICTLCMRDFEIAQHILQIAQIDKLRPTITIIPSGFQYLCIG